MFDFSDLVVEVSEEFEADRISTLVCRWLHKESIKLVRQSTVNLGTKELGKRAERLSEKIRERYFVGKDGAFRYDLECGMSAEDQLKTYNEFYAKIMETLR